MEQQNFPKSLETERLLLRCYRPQDAAGILELVQSNRVPLIREFAQIAALQTVQDAQRFAEEKCEQWRQRKTFCYGIWRKSGVQQIGQIQAKNIAWDIPSAELGYFIGVQWQRRGYASESVQRLLRVAFQDLEFERIFVRILPSNRQSFLLARKLGFQEEGLQRRAFRCGFGELHDVQFLSLTREAVAADFTRI